MHTCKAFVIIFDRTLAKLWKNYFHVNLRRDYNIGFISLDLLIVYSMWSNFYD